MFDILKAWHEKIVMQQFRSSEIFGGYGFASTILLLQNFGRLATAGGKMTA